MGMYSYVLRILHVSPLDKLLILNGSINNTTSTLIVIIKHLFLRGRTI